MESKGTSFILIIIIAVLTLTLAVLAGYIFLVQDDKADPTEVTVVYSKEVPDESELTTIQLFDSTKYFNLKNTDTNRISVIQVGISLQYFNEIKQNKSIVVADKINAYFPEIKEMTGTYFLGVSLEDVKQPEFKQHTKEVLKEQINTLLNTGDQTSYEYVYKVIFDDWLFQ